MVIVYLLLFSLFVFVVATVAAFVYLSWWQAIIASALTFLALLFAGKLLIALAIRRFSKFAREMFNVKSKVLRGATVQVHSIRPTEPPADLAPWVGAENDEEFDEENREQLHREMEEYRWFNLDLTITPHPESDGPLDQWDAEGLCFVPADSKPPEMFGVIDPQSEMVTPHRVQVFDHGRTVDTDSDANFEGARRLIITAGFPPSMREVAVRYFFEQFGRIRLPA